MASSTLAGGGKGVDGGGDLPCLRSGPAGGIYGDGGDDSSSAYSTDDDDFLEPLLSMEQRLWMAQLWVANPSTSHHWTHGIGGVLFNEDIWEVRIHFDAQEPLKRKLCSSDVTYLNIVALMETQGFSVHDCLYHIENPGLGEQGLEMVDSNAELQMIKRQNKDTLVLNLLVRACPPPVSNFDRQQCHKQELSPIVYEEPVVLDLSEPPILAVDQQGVVFESQCSSCTAAQAPAVCTQERRNVNAKLKAVLEEEEEGYQGYEAYEDSDASASDNEDQIGSDPMCDAEDLEMQEGKRQREEEVEEEEIDDEQSEEEEVLHYEGDTEVEELFELEEDNTLVSEEQETIAVPTKKKQKLPVRRRPTTRSHSSVSQQVEPDFKPSSDEEEKGLRKESDDDCYEPLSFVLPKKRKSRAKKRPARKWYNEKMEQPHQQLCLHLCFRDQHQFRDALLNLHIT